VLFVVRGMSLKTEFRVGIAYRKVAFGQDCKAIIPAAGVNGKFLALALKARSRQILAMVDEAGHGTGRLPTDMISKLEIYIPELREQQLIAEIIDSFDTEISSTDALLKKLALLRTGIIRDALARLPGGLSTTVGALFAIKAGITLGPDRAPGTNASKYLRVANVQREDINLSDVALLEATPSEKVELQLRIGDLLVVEGHANVDEIGRCALIGPDAAGLLYQNHLFRLRSSVVDPEFAEIWLNSDAARAYWRRMSATSSGLHTINSQALRSMPFPTASREAQREVSRAQQLIAQKISTTKAELAKLRMVRQGLMEDLLTGRVRVSGLS
jgi:restriction endonuclease S subunit